MIETRISKSSPKNIIISHVYSSNNKGDAALTSVLIQDIKRAFPKAAITILRLEPVKLGTKFEGVPERPSFMSFALNRYKNPIIKLAYTAYMVSLTLLWAMVRRLLGWRIYLPDHLRRVVSIYDKADLIVPVGGGYIRSRLGLMQRVNIPLLLHPLLFGCILGKPTVLYSQSVGPFQNAFERWLVAFVLKRMTNLFIREEKSVQLLAALGVTQNVVRTIDSGFLLRSKTKMDIRKDNTIPDDALLIGVTVRAWLKGDAQNAYERAVAVALDTMIARHNAYVIFIPQVTATKGDDDRIASKRVFGHMRGKNNARVITGTPDHHEIKAMYDKLDILLGTRFHSVIFSLTSYVPVVAIEYEHKTSGIMQDLELTNWVIDIEKVTEQNLSDMLEELIAKRHEYNAELRRSIPPYIRKTRATAKMLANSYFSV